VNEKGFIIGIGNTIKRIMFKKAYKSSQIHRITQNGNREFITLIACVSVTSIAIPPTILFQSKSGDLQNTWIKDVKTNQEVFFGGNKNE